MKPKVHIPGRPSTPEPQNLAEVAANLKHRDVLNSGITTTQKGDWALLVTVKKNASLPIAAVEKGAEGFPVIYEHESGRIPVARPAYPAKGE